MNSNVEKIAAATKIARLLTDNVEALSGGDRPAYRVAALSASAEFEKIAALARVATSETEGWTKKTAKKVAAYANRAAVLYALAAKVADETKPEPARLTFTVGASGITRNADPLSAANNDAGVAATSVVHSVASLSVYAARESN